MGACVGGQPVQYSTKDRSQCMENDKFLVTKKVAIEKLPDPKDRRAVIND